MVNKGDELKATIKDVQFFKEERMAQGAQYGSYTSNYVARFREYPNGIAVVDELASDMHPDWDKKTDNRANILSRELAGKKVNVLVTEVYDGKDTFEGVIQL